MKKLITFIILLGMLLGVSSLSEASTKKTQIFIGDVAPTSCVTGDGWIDTSNTNTPTLKFCTTVSPITFVSNDLTLGTTSGTAGRGDYANTAYNHSQNNTQAHTDYLTNNADDNMVGSLSISNNLTALGRTSLVDLSSTGYISTLALNTGLGLNELYGMDQNVKTTNAVTFATINTGYGAYELGQSNRTSDSQYVQNLTSTDTVFADDFESVTDAGILALDGDVTTSNDVTIGRNLSVDGNISGDRIYGVQWSDLNGTPADFADGTDANTTYTAGYGIVLDSTTFRINGNLTDDDVTLADVQAACSNDFHTIGGVDGGGDGGASLPINLSDDASVTGTLSNAHLPNNLTKSLDWDEITINMPAGFADGVDNTGGGDTIWAEDGAYVVLDITRSDSDVSLANNLYVAEKIYGDGSELSNLPIPDLDDLTVTSFAMTTNPADGFVMVSDGNGNGTWQYIGSTEISPSGIQVINGTNTEGDLSSLQTNDNASYVIQESTGVSPLDVNVTFSGVTDMSKFVIREYYSGLSSHHVEFQVWDWVGSTWETYWDIVGQDGYTVITMPILDPASHIGTGDNLGNVKLRFHHVQTGVSTHYLSLDFIQLVYGDFEGGSTNLAGYAKYNFSYNNFVGNGNFATEGNITTSSNITASNVFGTIQTASQPTIDHGSLAGKTDDDHTQYVLQDGSEINDFTGDVDIKGGSLSISNNLSVAGKTYGADALLSGNISLGSSLTSTNGNAVDVYQTTNGNTTTAKMIRFIDNSAQVDNYSIRMYNGTAATADSLAIYDDAGNRLMVINEGGSIRLGLTDEGEGLDGSAATPQVVLVNTAIVRATEGIASTFLMSSDQSDDDSDDFQIVETDSSDLNMQVYDASGGNLINAIEIEKYSTGRAGEVSLNYGATITGDLTNNGNMTITGVAKVDKIQSIVSTGWLGIDGDITTSNDVTVGRNLSVDGNIRGDYLYGNGAGISNIDWNNITTNMPVGFSDGIDNEGAGLPINLASDASVTGVLGVSHLSPTLTQGLVLSTSLSSNAQLVTELEFSLEAVMDLNEMQGEITTAQLPDNVTTGLVLSVNLSSTSQLETELNLAQYALDSDISTNAELVTELAVFALDTDLSSNSELVTELNLAQYALDTDLSSNAELVAELESSLEAVMDIPDLQGEVTTAQLPDNVTTGLVLTADTSAWDKNSSDDIVLGTTSGTAYRGDYGDTAYNHSQDNTQGHSDYLLNNADDTTSGMLFVTDSAYGVGWDGRTSVPTMNALYDKIETLGALGGMVNATDTNDGVQVTGNLSVSNDATVVNTFFANAIEFDSDVIDFQGSLSVASSLNTYGTIFGGQLGYINGFVLSASTSTTITIGPGSVHCKDKFFQMLSSTVDTISNYSNLNITYLYIDYSASTDSNIVFIDSTTAPTWSDAYLGWYNGDDRCYGALFCDSASTFMRFFSNGQNNDVSYLFGIVVLNLSTNMDPNAAWQAPDDYATSSVLPVNATAIYISLRNSDSATGVSVYATNKESALNGVPGAGSQISCWGYQQVCVSQWITLGPSRDIVIAGVDDDDNTLNCQYVGFRIRR